MTIIFEAQKEDGTRQLLTNGFIKDIQREIGYLKTKSVRKRNKMVVHLLAQYCWLNGYVSIDSIEYDSNTMRRVNLIYEA